MEIRKIEKTPQRNGQIPGFAQLCIHLFNTESSIYKACNKYLYNEYLSHDYAIVQIEIFHM